MEHSTRIDSEKRIKKAIFQICSERAKEVYAACMENGKHGSPQGAIRFDCAMKYDQELVFCTHELKTKFGTTS
jgi:hypothetical protein